MACKICSLYTETSSTKSTDCILEFLDKIKFHYMHMMKKIDDNTSAMKGLTERNIKLQEKLKNLERSSKNDSLRFEEECDRSGWCPDALGNETLNKTDSLNVALNDEIDFDNSYVSDSPNSFQKQKVIKREPMKPIVLENSPTKEVAKKIKEEIIEQKREISFLSKENKFVPGKDVPRKIERTLTERPKLSLKSGLRQKRLQFGAKKKTSNMDSFLGKQISPIRLTPSLSEINKSQKSPSIQNDSLDADHTFDFASPFRKRIVPKDESFLPKNESESSSVMILTPETQDVIFLDDSCSSNIESMDLLRDFVKPSDNRLTNLKLFESNRIKMLQKTASTKAMNVPTDIERKKDDSCHSSTLDNLEETNLNESARLELEETKLSTPKQKTTPPKNERLLKLNCAECEKYIKYLGNRLTDEEIEQHIRNCTKHKMNAEIKCTPDGFWDPMMKPLDKDDPRVRVLTDTRFVRRQQ